MKYFEFISLVLLCFEVLQTFVAFHSHFCKLVPFLVETGGLFSLFRGKSCRIAEFGRWATWKFVYSDILARSASHLFHIVARSASWQTSQLSGIFPECPEFSVLSGIVEFRPKCPEFWKIDQNEEKIRFLISWKAYTEKHLDQNIGVFWGWNVIHHQIFLERLSKLEFLW